MLFCTYNIHYGVGADGKHDLARIADVVAEADIVAIQEAVSGWPQNAFVDQTAEIAVRLNRYCWFHGAMEADASEVMADGRIVNRRRMFGNALLSRWPISWARGHLLPKTRLANCFDAQRGVVEASIATPADDLRVYSVHLSHTGPQQRLPQVRTLMEIVASADRVGTTWDGAGDASFMFQEQGADMPRSAIVAGDFNFTAAHPEYPLVCGETSPYGRLGTALHLADAWTAAGNAEDGAASFPDEGRIDHVFVTHDLVPKVKKAWIGHGIDASDHWPLFVEFDLPAGS